LYFHVNFRIGLSIICEEHWGHFDGDCIEHHVECFRQYYHFHNIDSTKSGALGIIPSSDVFFYFFISSYFRGYCKLDCFFLNLFIIDI
jgi:hypothetical protein